MYTVEYTLPQLSTSLPVSFKYTLLSCLQNLYLSLLLSLLYNKSSYPIIFFCVSIEKNQYFFKNVCVKLIKIFKMDTVLYQLIAPFQ